MTAPTLAPAVDPTGLSGERVHRDEAKSPCIEEMWTYPATIGLASIRDAWVAAMPVGSCTAVKEYRVSAGRRFVHITFLRREPNAPLHIEEPLDV